MEVEVIIQLTLEEAALIVQSIEMCDWTYCGEGARAEELVRRLRRKMAEQAESACKSDKGVA